MHLAGQRIGVFGGTFDPPHIGHLVAALEVRYALDLDRVLMVVANEPWQKLSRQPTPERTVPGRQISSAGDRLAMVEAAVADLAGLEASDLEIRRGGPSYTFDTLADLSALSSAELFLVVGADAAAGLPGWHRAEELAGLARLVVVDRPGPTGTEGVGTERAGADVIEGWEPTRVPVTQLDVSSTELRERFRRGAPVEPLVPRATVELIERRGLYR